MLDLQPVGQSVLVWSHHLGPKIRFTFLSDSCGFVHVERPLRREDGSVAYSCCWPLAAQSFSGPVSDWRLPQPGGSGPHIYILQEQGGSVIPSGTGLPFLSPPTTRRVTVEVFDPASTLDF
jgi:hypothetical protein